MRGWTAVVRMTLAACAAVALLMLTAPGAQAASCGAYNPVCPWQSTQSYGGTDPGSLNGPFAIAAAPNGDIVVADRAKESVREFSADGQFLQQIGTPGSYTDLSGVAVDPSSGEIWVAENCEILGFGSDGTQNEAIGGCGSGGPSAAVGPAAIAVGPDSTLYVLSSYTPTVREFSPGGTLQDTFSVASAYPNYTATGGNGAVQGSIAVDSSGDVFVEPLVGPIHEYTSAGTDIGNFPGPGDEGIVVAGGDLYVADEQQITAYALADPSTIGQSGGAQGSSGVGVWSGSFDDNNTGISAPFTVTASGLDVATTSHTIEQFDANGNETGTWGGLANDDFVATQALSDAAGDVFVFDGSNDRIIEYDAAGDGPQVFATMPAGQGIGGAAINPAGDLVVSTGSELLTYNSSGQVISTQTTSCGCELLGITSAGDVWLSGYGGSYQDSGGVFEYAPNGALLNTWAVSANYLALGANGDIYGSNFVESDSALNTDIAQFSPSGHLLQVISGDQGWEPALPGSIAVDANGDIYEQGSDSTIRLISPSGSLLAVWPDTPGTLSVENGSVFDASGTQVTRFSDFLNPLPPVPSSGDSPFNLAMEASLLSLIAPSQSGIQTLTAPITCTGSADCSGAAELTTTVASTTAHRTATELLGESAFTLVPGQSTPVRIALNRTARLALAKRSVKATLTLVYSAGTNRKTLTRSVMLIEAPAALRAQIAAGLTSAESDLAGVRRDATRSPVLARQAGRRLVGAAATVASVASGLASDTTLQTAVRKLKVLTGRIAAHPGLAGSLSRQFGQLSAEITRRVSADTRTPSAGA